MSEVGSVSNNFLVFLEVVEYLSEQEDDVKVQLSNPEKRRSIATSLQGLRATHIHTETVSNRTRLITQKSGLKSLTGKKLVNN